MPPTIYRGPTARDLLEIEWDHPVYVPPEQEKSGETASKQYRRALPRAEALAYVAGDDPRPLLVLRECATCNGTDAALLKGGTENERTYLLASWFHCVKLPVDVMQEDHPFHNLFVTENVEHLFVSSVDGSNHDPLESQTSAKELWDSMHAVIALEYEKKPDSALKKVKKLLGKMDLCDQRWDALAAERDRLLEEEGPDAKDLLDLRKEILALEAEREDLRAAFAKASRLELKEQKPPAKEGGAPPDAPDAPNRPGSGA